MWLSGAPPPASRLGTTFSTATPPFDLESPSQLDSSPFSWIADQPILPAERIATEHSPRRMYRNLPMFGFTDRHNGSSSCDRQRAQGRQPSGRPRWRTGRARYHHHHFEGGPHEAVPNLRTRPL